MRVDRTLSLYLFHPLRKVVRRSTGIRIPILMYHSISDEPESGHPYFWINTSPKRFAEQMRSLKENDYEVISLADGAEILKAAPINPDHSADGIPRKYAVVTFDDGFADFRTAAFPILAEYGFCATVFLPTGTISDGISAFKGKTCLRWSEVCELAGSGIRFGSHTVTHPKLKGLPWEQVEKELRESKTVLEDRLGTEVESFSYPYAFPEEDHGFKARLKASLAGLGYRNGVTTIIGTAIGGDDRLFLKRLPVNRDDDPAFFLSKLESGYDWVHDLQYGSKFINSLRIGTE
jgi:peptidoglycan/xylan/chitin deacetylase (PgdA/CDA1 family)